MDDKHRRAAMGGRSHRLVRRWAKLTAAVTALALTVSAVASAIHDVKDVLGS